MAAFGCGAHFHSSEDAPGKFIEISDASDWLTDAACIFCDVREENECKERGVIPGAMRLSAGHIMFPKPALRKKVDSLRSINKPIVFYTDYGVPASRCGSVCEYLVEKEEFPADRLYRLKGGLDGWKAEGHPICQMDDAEWQVASKAQWTPLVPKILGPGSKTVAGEAAAGKSVVINGLTSEAGKALNGQEAVVQSYDKEKMRYTIKLQKSGDVKALKADNLKLAT